MATDKRGTPRIQPFVAPCRILVGTRRLTGYLTELSPQGARVLCDQPSPNAGTPVTLEVRFGRRVRQSRLPVEIKWVRSARGTHTVGLTFQGIGAEDQRILDAIVAEFQQRAALLA